MTTTTEKMSGARKFGENSEAVRKAKKEYRTIDVIEQNGGDSRLTRRFWPLQNHSGGDKRFPTSGAKATIIQRFGGKVGREIIHEGGAATRSSSRMKTSTPCKVFRARLVRPSSWTNSSSSDKVFAPRDNSVKAELVDLTKEDSGVELTRSKVDTGVKRNVMGAPQVIDLVDSEKEKPEADFYPLSHIWDSDEEDQRVAKEAQCHKCSR